MKKIIRVTLPIRSGSHSTIELAAGRRSRGDDRRRRRATIYSIKIIIKKIKGELDTTDMHTSTPEVPRRTSLVRNLRRPWAPREHSPERTKKKKKKVDAPPPCAVSLAKCRRYRGTLSCAGRASGGEAQSL